VELVLALQDESQIRVTCDDQYSHTADLHPLLFQNEQEARIIFKDPAAYGKKLYAALFPPNSIAQQALADMPERLLIVAPEPQLDAIAWEYLYGSFGTDDPASPESTENFLVLECPFVRGLPTSQRISLPPIDQSLHIVAIPSNPLSDTHPPLTIDAEWTRLKESIQQVPAAIVLERTIPPTLERVRHLVANQKGRVVHFMGHGGQDQQGAMLYFEQDNGAPHLFTAKEFVQRLRGTIFLVTLNACISATPGPTSFHNLAAALVRQKTPYALGMRLSILDEDARTFSRVFYSELARGVPVEEALFQTRLTLAKSQHSWVVGVPVLYTSLTASAPGFVSRDGTPTVKDRSSHVDISALPPVEGTFQGRINAMIALGTELTGDQRPRILTILGSGGQGKTALALKLVERFAFAWSGGVWATTLENLPTRSTFVIALAQFLGIETQKTLNPTDIERLILARLNERRTLLVLDNAETLVEAVEAKNTEALDLVAFLKKLLGTAVRLLVTSRVALGWDDEHTYELDGLSLKEGAALFRQGAPQRRSEINLTVAASLSRQLEGHPLGLRLLAGAFNEISLSLPAFIQTTEERLREAENKYVGLEHRHRKLYACIETSVRSLTPALRSLLSGLWIFHAPFLAQTAVAIFDLDAQKTEQQTSPVRDQLYQLQRRSLLTRKTVTARDGTLQLYALLPTTRPYIEHHLEQAYDCVILKKRLITAYSLLARFAHDELNRSAVVVALMQEGREDFEWVCEAFESVYEAFANEEIATIQRGRYLRYWGWVVYRLGNSLRGLYLLEGALEALQGMDTNLTLQVSNKIALVYSDTGRPQEALQLYEEALPIMREVGDRTGEATTLNNMASVYSDIGQRPKALQLYEEALPISREIGDRACEAATLNNMAGVYRRTGQPQKALPFYEEVLSISREAGDRVREAATLNNMASVYSDMGQLPKALQLHEEALPIRREIGDRTGEAATLNNMASVYSDTGQSLKAMQFYEEALLIRREVGDRAGEAVTLNNMALVYSDTGQSLKAMQFYEEALLIRRGVEDRAGEAATLNNMASVYYRTGNSKKALQVYEEALSIRRAVGDRAGEATTLTNMAVVYSNTGQPEKALLLYEEALPIIQAIDDRAGEATALNSLAYLYQSLKRYSEAITAFNRSIDLSQQIIYPAMKIAGLIGLAFLLYRHLNRTVDAIALEKALRVFATTGLLHDAAEQTIEQVQQWLAMMRDENISEPPSTLPFKTIQQIVSNTIAAMLVASSHRLEWIELITSVLQVAQQQGTDRQAERDFFTTILAFLDGQSPTLPPDHPYAQAIEEIRKGVTPPTGEETL
jgi:tetratricopeptide (TPR) repeat protein